MTPLIRTFVLPHYNVSTKEARIYQEGRFRATRQPGTPGLPVRARPLLSA
jgi:hypothetical protein